MTSSTLISGRVNDRSFVPHIIPCPFSREHEGLHDSGAFAFSSRIGVERSCSVNDAVDSCEPTGPHSPVVQEAKPDRRPEIPLAVPQVLLMIVPMNRE